MIPNIVQWSLKMSNQRAWKESFKLLLFHSQFKGLRYYCSLKHNDTKILHHALPFYFLFYFPFSSKRHFPAKKCLATSLEIKIKWPSTLSPHNKHVCFHRKTVFFWHLWIWTRVLFYCREGNWGLKVTLLYREHMDQLAVRRQHFRGTMRNLCHMKKKIPVYYYNKQCSIDYMHLRVCLCVLVLSGCVCVCHSFGWMCEGVCMCACVSCTHAHTFRFIYKYL